MRQADVVMWLGKELQTQSLGQLGVRLCDPLSQNDLSLCTGKQGEVVLFLVKI